MLTDYDDDLILVITWLMGHDRINDDDDDDIFFHKSVVIYLAPRNCWLNIQAGFTFSNLNQEENVFPSKSSKEGWLRYKNNQLWSLSAKRAKWGSLLMRQLIWWETAKQIGKLGEGRREETKRNKRSMDSQGFFLKGHKDKPSFRVDGWHW